MTVNEVSISATAVSASRGFASGSTGRPALVLVHPACSAPAAGWIPATPLEIGRGAQAQIRVSEDARVSRRHARVGVAGDALRVHDLDSRHGTFVNGVRVPSGGATAGVGSVVRVGQTLLLVVNEPDARSPQVRRIDAKPLRLVNDVMAGPQLFRCWQLATQVAALRQPALILGETGSGKEALARVIHAAQSRPGPFVALNVSAIPASLFEAALFGHERGAFTGAAGSRLGAFREASGGVLFLDEVGHLRGESQASLLRALDQRQVRPLGASHDVPVDVRVVAATSQKLAELCDPGQFRRDLFYRLSGIVISVPPLRERRADILPIAASYLASQGADVTFSADVAEQLLLAEWEGNVRQLQNTLTQALVALASSREKQLRVEHLPRLSAAGPGDEITPDMVSRAMSQARGNASSAARTLGVSRTTLYNLFRRYAIQPGSLRGGAT